MYRLSGSADTVIGRASDNDIILKSHQASRRHARIWSDQGWWLEDLESRNGVTVNGRPIKACTSLSPGDRVVLGGFELSFVHQLTDANLSTGPSGPVEDDQVTSDDVLASVTSKLPTRGLLAAMDQMDQEPGQGDSLDRHWLQMAFGLGRCESMEDAAGQFFEALKSQMPHASIGLYIAETPDDESADLLTSLTLELPPPRWMHQNVGRRYRRPPAGLVQQVLQPGAPAIVARNVAGDHELATENTQGEVDVESILLSPLSSGDRSFGFVHMTTSAHDEPMDDSDLRRVVIAGEVFSAAVDSIGQRAALTASLDATRRTIEHLRSKLDGRLEIIGRSPVMQRITQQLAQVAETDVNVLIRGESGVGKELIAAAIHHASRRRDKPMVCLNCAALSKDLLESELFGHEAGAFTGATRQKRGKFEQAHGGTLMLDEIGEMSLDLQAKLLRVLEGHPFERVGGHEPVKADVRVVAATHRDLQAMVGQNQFRQDLYYRLHVVELVVPPLRERGDDIQRLATHFHEELSDNMGRPAPGFTANAIKKLNQYDWPGNVRELRNVIERAMVLMPTQGRTRPIDADDLWLSAARQASVGESSSTSSGPPPVHGSVKTNVLESKTSLAEMERRHILQTLEGTGGNKSQAASILGIERSTLDRKLKRYAQQRSVSTRSAT